MLPSDIFVKLKDVTFLVRPRVECVGEVPQSMPKATADRGYEVLGLRNSVRVYAAMIDGWKDKYSLLSRDQPTVVSGKVPLPVMYDILNRFGNGLIYKYSAVVGVIHWDPASTLPDYKIPAGKNAVMHYGNRAAPEAVSWPEESGFAEGGMLETLGLKEWKGKVYVYSDKKEVVRSQKGIAAIRIVGYPGGRIDVASVSSATRGDQERGTLVGVLATDPNDLISHGSSMACEYISFRLEGLRKKIDSSRNMIGRFKSEKKEKSAQTKSRIAELEKLVDDFYF